MNGKKKIKIKIISIYMFHFQRGKDEKTTYQKEGNKHGIKIGEEGICT